MQKYGYTHTGSMRLKGELDKRLSSSSTNPVENKTLYQEFNDIRVLIETVRAKVELTNEQLDILGYMGTEDLRARVGSAKPLVPESVSRTDRIFWSQNYVSPNGTFANTQIRATSAYSTFRNYAGQMTPAPEMVTMAGHYGSQGYLVALKLRARFLKSGWYALQLYTQINRSAPRALKAESAWRYIDTKDVKTSLDGSDVTFEFTDPVVVSSLRDPSSVSDQDAVGFELLFIPDDGAYTDYTYQTTADPVRAEGETDDEFQERIEEHAAGLLPQISYFDPSKYSIPGVSWNNGCWLYEPEIFGRNAGPNIDPEITTYYASDKEIERIKNAQDVTAVRTAQPGSGCEFVKGVSVTIPKAGSISTVSVASHWLNTDDWKTQLAEKFEPVPVKVVVTSITEDGETYVGTSVNHFIMTPAVLNSNLETAQHFIRKFRLQNADTNGSTDLRIYFIKSSEAMGDRRDFEMVGQRSAFEVILDKCSYVPVNMAAGTSEILVEDSWIESQTAAYAQLEIKTEYITSDNIDQLDDKYAALNEFEYASVQYKEPTYSGNSGVASGKLALYSPATVSKLAGRDLTTLYIKNRGSVINGVKLSFFVGTEVPSGNATAAMRTCLGWDYLGCTDVNTNEDGWYVWDMTPLEDLITALGPDMYLAMFFCNIDRPYVDEDDNIQGLVDVGVTCMGSNTDYFYGSIRVPYAVQTKFRTINRASALDEHMADTEVHITEVDKEMLSNLRAGKYTLPNQGVISLASGQGIAAQPGVWLKDSEEGNIVFTMTCQDNIGYISIASQQADIIPQLLLYGKEASIVKQYMEGGQLHTAYYISTTNFSDDFVISGSGLNTVIGIANPVTAAEKTMLANLAAGRYTLDTSGSVILIESGAALTSTTGKAVIALLEDGNQGYSSITGDAIGIGAEVDDGIYTKHVNIGWANQDHSKGTSIAIESKDLAIGSDTYIYGDVNVTTRELPHIVAPDAVTAACRLDNLGTLTSAGTLSDGTNTVSLEQLEPTSYRYAIVSTNSSTKVDDGTSISITDRSGYGFLSQDTGADYFPTDLADIVRQFKSRVGNRPYNIRLVDNSWIEITATQPGPEYRLNFYINSSACDDWGNMIDPSLEYRVLDSGQNPSRTLGDLVTAINNSDLQVTAVVDGSGIVLTAKTAGATANDITLTATGCFGSGTVQMGSLTAGTDGTQPEAGGHLKVNGKDVLTTDHSDNMDMHVSAADRERWNAASTSAFTEEQRTRILRMIEIMDDDRLIKFATLIDSIDIILDSLNK